MLDDSELGLRLSTLGRFGGFEPELPVANLPAPTWPRLGAPLGTRLSRNIAIMRSLHPRLFAVSFVFLLPCRPAAAMSDSQNHSALTHGRAPPRRAEGLIPRYFRKAWANSTPLENPQAVATAVIGISVSISNFRACSNRVRRISSAKVRPSAAPRNRCSRTRRGTGKALRISSTRIPSQACERMNRRASAICGSSIARISVECREMTLSGGISLGREYPLAVHQSIEKLTGLGCDRLTIELDTGDGGRRDAAEQVVGIARQDGDLIRNSNSLPLANLGQLSGRIGIGRKHR